MYNNNTSCTVTTTEGIHSIKKQQNLVSSAKFSDSALCILLDVVQCLISLLICREIGCGLWEREKQKLTGTTTCFTLLNSTVPHSTIHQEKNKN